MVPDSALAHVNPRDATAEVGASQVGCEDVVPLVGVDLEEGARHGARSVVHPHVHVTPALDGDVQTGIDGLEPSHVEIDRDGTAHRPGRIPGPSAEPLGVEVPNTTL